MVGNYRSTTAGSGTPAPRRVLSRRRSVNFTDGRGARSAGARRCAARLHAAKSLRDAGRGHGTASAPGANILWRDEPAVGLGVLNVVDGVIMSPQVMQFALRGSDGVTFTVGTSIVVRRRRARDRLRRLERASTCGMRGRRIGTCRSPVSHPDVGEGFAAGNPSGLC